MTLRDIGNTIVSTDLTSENFLIGAGCIIGLLLSCSPSSRR